MVVGQEGTPTEAVEPVTPAVAAPAEPTLSADPVEVDESQWTDPVAEKAKNIGKTPAPEVGAEPPKEGGDPATPAGVTEEFKPSFKFRYADSAAPKGHLEKEMPEWLHGSVKTKEQEAYLKEIHEKANGLPFVAQRFHEQREKTANLETQIRDQYEPVQTELRKVGKAIEAKDFDTVFARFKISPIDVYKWVDQKLKYQEMPPEQRQELDRQRELSIRAREGDDQVSSLSASLNQQAFELRKLQLDTAFTTPTVSAAAQKFDAQYGDGAFRTQVIRAGQLAASATNPSQRRDMSVAEAIQSVIQAFRLDAQPAPASAPAAAQASAATPAAQARKEAPVIPHVSGRNAAPAGKMVTSIAQLRELGKQRVTS